MASRSLESAITSGYWSFSTAALDRVVTFVHTYDGKGAGSVRYLEAPTSGDLGSAPVSIL